MKRMTRSIWGESEAAASNDMMAGRAICANLPVVMVSLGWLLSLPGCQWLEPEETETSHPQLVAATNPFESDIPVPGSFRIVEGVSEDYRQGGRRVFLRHRYVGTAAKIAVRSFYRDQMPLGRWTPLRDYSLRGAYTMQFEKGGDYCTIIVADDEQAGRGHVVVDVCVAPGLPEGSSLKRVP